MPGERAAEVHPKAVEQTAVAYGRSLTILILFPCMIRELMSIVCVCVGVTGTP